MIQTAPGKPGQSLIRDGCRSLPRGTCGLICPPGVIIAGVIIRAPEDKIIVGIARL